MKTIILCGGKGTRLSEETKLTPKPMVKIGNKPIIVHIINIYMKYGLKDFISPGVPKIHPQTSIAVFHGDPQPKHCQDPWCKENWK